MSKLFLVSVTKKLDHLSAPGSSGKGVKTWVKG